MFTARRRALPVTIALAVVLAIAGCSSSGTSTTSSTSGTTASATAALGGEPTSLDPIQDTSLISLNVYYEIYDQLTTINAKGKVAPRLATKWTSSNDLKTWVFTLRHNAKFSDGTNVTANDVVFTYEKSMTDSSSPEASYTSTIASVKATGTYEVTFTLKASYAPFANQTTLIPILPQKAYTSMGATAFAAKPVGSGPYSVVKWTKGVSLTLKRNDSYWGTKGSVKNLTYAFVADDTTRANSLQSGSLDVGLLAPAQVSAAQRASAISVKTEQSNRVVYVGLNQKKTPMLANADLRKAVSLAISRTAISKKLLNGTAEPTGQLLAPVTFGYDKSIKAPEQDLAQAKKLVKESGYDGSTITLSYPTTSLPQVPQVAQAVAAYLEDAGLKIKLDGEEVGTYSTNWFSGSLPGLYIFAFAPSTLDGDLPYELLARSGATGSFTDTQIDDLLTAEVGEADTAKRQQDFDKVAQIIADKNYYVPLYTDSYSYGVKMGLDWSPLPEGFIQF